MQTGRLHRYNVAPTPLHEPAESTVGRARAEAGEVGLFEQEFARYVGRKYALACASCGSAMQLALKSVGVRAGDGILCSGFTLTPVPGAIERTGGLAILVEINERYTVDLADLERKARSSAARWLLLSHMRGHVADMEAVAAICQANDIGLIEDCAHTLGATWRGRHTGSFGRVGCFSTQTYKHINSGEGGLLVTDDEDIAARAILQSGSYMLYERHLCRPPLSAFETLRDRLPNYSCRMDHLRAAILRPQLQRLDAQITRWNERYQLLERRLRSIPRLHVPERACAEGYVGSSIQFNVEDATDREMTRFVAVNRALGVELKWFGRPESVGFTSRYPHWQFLPWIPKLPQTDAVLATLCDMRIPLTFALEDCEHIADVVVYAAQEVWEGCG